MPAAGVSPAHKGKQESVSVVAKALQSDYLRCAILLLSCGLGVSSDRSLILSLPVATDVRLMDPCSEIMWGSSGRREKQLSFFPRIQLGMRKQNGKGGGVGGDAVCLVTGQRPWFVQMTSSFYYP